MASMTRDNLHSRTVAGLKIFLPLVALAILSTLFLVSTSNRHDDAIPYADVDVADLLREPRLSGPSFAGMTADGAALTFRAREALPGTAGSDLGGLARDLTGILETPDGITTRLTAGEARLDISAQQVLLTGGVSLSVSSGYELSFTEGQISLDRTNLLGFGGVRLSGPMGAVTSGTLNTSPAKDSPHQYLMVFKGRVRLLYQP